jgi:deoxyribonuclease-4
MLLGSHLSIAGGLHNALIKAHKYRFDTLGMFVRNQRQWRAPPLSPLIVRRFRAVRRKLQLGPVVAHGSYLLNLAGRDDVRERSIDALAEDLARCSRLGIEYLVIHPGSHVDPAEGIALIADAIDHVLTRSPGRCRILLETTSGAGNTICARFEQLAEILRRLRTPRRVGVCLDTCHVFAAGYDIRGPKAYADTMAEFDAAVGLRRLRAIHLNDSRGELGSRLDRHEHIGRGRIGRRGFASFVRDRRLAGIPMILETPKGKDPRGRDWDLLNARTLRRLQARR